MRRHRRPDFQSWKTELWFAAALKRAGSAITLEPQVGGNVCEFVTHAPIDVYWEIKSPLDIRYLRDEEALLLDVQKRFRRIPEPYVLELVAADVSAVDLPAASADVRRQLASANAKELLPPLRFASQGLVICVTALSSLGHGYLGIISSEHVFEGEHAKTAAKSIKEAASQLHRGGPGIVVLDPTNAEWLAEHDVVDACFGREVVVLKDGQANNVHRGAHLLRRTLMTRVSAVVSYSRRWTRYDRDHALLVIHNPFAASPLPDRFPKLPEARHLRPVEIRKGFLRSNQMITSDRTPSRNAFESECTATLLRRSRAT